MTKNLNSIPQYTFMAKSKQITTIKLQKQTKSRLDKLKEHKRETYDDILRKMLWILNIIKTNPEKAQYTLKKIDEIQGKIKSKSNLSKP